MNTINPGMVETEGTHSGGFLEGDFVNKSKQKLRWAELEYQRILLQLLHFSRLMMLPGEQENPYSLPEDTIRGINGWQKIRMHRHFNFCQPSIFLIQQIPQVYHS